MISALLSLCALMPPSNAAVVRGALMRVINCTMTFLMDNLIFESPEMESIVM